jgi:hypothetical protein
MFFLQYYLYNIGEKMKFLSIFMERKSGQVALRFDRLTCGCGKNGFGHGLGRSGNSGGHLFDTGSGRGGNVIEDQFPLGAEGGFTDVVGGMENAASGRFGAFAFVGIENSLAGGSVRLENFLGVHIANFLSLSHNLLLSKKIFQGN